MKDNFVYNKKIRTLLISPKSYYLAVDPYQVVSFSYLKILKCANFIFVFSVSQSNKSAELVGCTGLKKSLTKLTGRL